MQASRITTALETKVRMANCLQNW